LRAAFDIEANGLHDATKIHCIVIADLDSDRIDQYGPDQIPAALEHLSRAAYLTGHNITGYDLPTLRRLHNWAPPASCTIVDTMIAARLILPNLDDLDNKVAAMTKTEAGKLRGRYSLEAFGMRLGIAKVGADIKDWSKWTPEMQERCIADTRITKALWQFLQPDGYPAEALTLEHRVARICERISADGVPFDVKAAAQLRQQWTARRAELGAQLSRQFSGTNLNSRKQLGALFEARGWIPEERTKKTKQPKITDEVLETIPATFPEFAGLAEYDILRRRLAQLTSGKEAWEKHINADGRIHGGLIHIGTPHSRAKHLTPNIAQVPNPKRGKPFATECRSLFQTSDDWVFVCCDQAGLQDRAFAHYLSEFDNGAYAKAFLNGLDPHWKCATDLELIAKNTALDKQNRVHAAVREHSKGFRYGFLFGMGPPRAGHIIYNTTRALNHIDAGNGLQQQFFGGNGHPNEAALKRVGKQALDKFIAGTPGLRRLRARLKCHVEDHGWLPGLDGRRVPTRAQYTALNYQVTSAEAVITKRWLIRVFDELNEKFRYGWNGDCVVTLWVHDEIAVCCRPELADEIGAIMVKHAKEPGEFYGFKVPLDADYKIGKSWAGNPVDIGSDAIKTRENSDARRTVGNSRPKADPRVPDGDGPHHQMHRENSARLAMASEISETPENGIDAAPEQKTDLEGQTAAASASSYTHHTHGNSGPKQGRSIATWIYAHPKQPNYLRVDKYVLASGERRFYQHHWNGHKWIYGVKNTYAETKIPYRLPELIAALPTEPVWICEGEKDTDNVAALGLVATTNPGGAKNWQPELAQWFKGKELAYIIEDNDDAGREHTRKIQSALHGITPNIVVISFPELPDKGDVSDWLDAGGNLKLLLARAEQARQRAKTSHAYVATNLATVKPRALRWIWPGHLARGGLELIAGTPEIGKSQIHCQYIACATTGRAWPNGTPGIVPCRVILLTAEDTIEDTLVPRLKAAEANLKLIEELKAIRRNNRDEMFLLGEDLDTLEQMIRDFGDVGLVTIDPITAYMGHAKHFDSHRATDVRSQLSPLKKLAEQTGVAFSAITHPPKNASARALDHFIGSQAFIAAARIGHLCVAEMEEGENGAKRETGRRFFTNPKINIEARQPTLIYQIDVVSIGFDEDSGMPIKAPVVRWEGESELTAEEALAASRPTKGKKGAGAKEFLADILINGPVLQKVIIERGAERGFSYKQLWRAKDALGAEDFRESGVQQGPSYWVLKRTEEDIPFDL
jgi:DNA polymerase I-like protein with 3'-5' exonuclease and polymerase domains